MSHGLGLYQTRLKIVFEGTLRRLSCSLCSSLLFKLYMDCTYKALRPLRVRELYNIALYSHIDPPDGGVEPSGEASLCGTPKQEEPGIEPATFRFPVNPLHHRRLMPPNIQPMFNPMHLTIYKYMVTIGTYL